MIKFIICIICLYVEIILWKSFSFAENIQGNQVVVCQKWTTGRKENFIPESNNAKHLLDYTQRYGYHLKLFYTNETFFAGKVQIHSSWLKLFAIYSLLKYENYDWVVFIDSTISPELSVESLLKHYPNKNSFLMLTADKQSIDPRIQIWKNTMENRELIQKWISLSREGNERVIRFANEVPYEVGAFPFLFSSNDILDDYHMELLPSSNFPETFNYSLDNESQNCNFINLSANASLLFQASLYELTPLHFANFLSLPVPRFSFELSIPDHENQDYNFTVIISWGDRKSGDYLWIKPSLFEQLFAGCLEQVQNLTSCNYFFLRMKDAFQSQRAEYDFYRGLEIIELYKRRYPAWSFLHSHERPFFRPLHHSASSASPLNSQSVSFSSSVHLLYHNHPKVIVTIFAGRKQYLELAMKYWKLALKRNIIQEIHLWDYVFGAKPGDINNEDRSYIHSLMNPSEGIYVKMRFSRRKAYSDYYEYYSQHGMNHPHDIIIKCDDDVVFIDIFRLPYFLSFINTENQTFNGILLANTINHPVATVYQQSLWNIFPEEFDIGHFDLPEYSNLLGPLWSSGRTADRIHEFFLGHWREVTRPMTSNGSTLEYSPPINGPIKDRFCINFFAMKASNFFKLQDIGEDDEFFLTVTLPQAGILENYMISNFFVSHMAYRAQLPEINISNHLPKYQQLFEFYQQQYSET